MMGNSPGWISCNSDRLPHKEEVYGAKGPTKIYKEPGPGLSTGGHRLFLREKRGAKSFFGRKKRGRILFLEDKKGGEDFFWRKKGGRRVFWEKKKGAKIFFGRKKRRRGLFLKKKRRRIVFFTAKPKSEFS